MQNQVTEEMPPPELNKDWRYWTGMSLLLLSLLTPLFALAIVPLLDLPTAVAAGIVGVATVGVPEVLSLAAIAFLGKDTFNYYKYKVLKLFKGTGPPKPVSKFRYYFGLSMFFGSIIPIYVKALFPEALPFDHETQIDIVLVSELVGVLSVFILGGEFWEKLKALFIWNAPAASSLQQPAS